MRNSLECVRGVIQLVVQQRYMSDAGECIGDQDVEAPLKGWRCELNCHDYFGIPSVKRTMHSKCRCWYCGYDVIAVGVHSSTQNQQQQPDEENNGEMHERRGHLF